MVQRCVASCRAARDAGQARLIVNLLVPLLPSVRPEDIDPWPGGLKQQFGTVEGLTKEILRGLVGNSPGQGALQVISDEDACALLIQEGSTSIDDCAAMIFPGVDQLGDLERIDKMVWALRAWACARVCCSAPRSSY